MDGPPDILSFEPRRHGARSPRPNRTRWPGPARTAILGLLLACLAVITYLALLVAQKDATITHLGAAPRTARSQASAGLSQAPAAPVVSGSTMFTLPQTTGGGSFSVVAVTISPQPKTAPLTWLFIYGRHADPGQRYGLIDDICGGQYVAPSAVADGTADRQGNVTIVASGLDMSTPGAWIMLYRWQDGAPLGGVQGPLSGTGARTFRTAPRC